MSGLSPKRMVLVVEDDRDVREAITEILLESDYEAMPAANGAEALERLRAAQVRPCVILLDIMMPTMDGWQFRSKAGQRSVGSLRPREVSPAQYGS